MYRITAVSYTHLDVYKRQENDGYVFNPEATLGIIFGEVSAPYDSERVQAVLDLFSGTGLHYRATDCILEEIWSKFLSLIHI